MYSHFSIAAAPPNFPSVSAARSKSDAFSKPASAMCATASVTASDNPRGAHAANASACALANSALRLGSRVLARCTRN